MSDFKKIPPPNWEGESLNRLWRENAAAVPDAVNARDRGMMKRIATYCRRFGYDCKRVIDKIISDEMFAAHFTKDPTKQGIHEKIAANYLRKFKCIDNFEILPRGGRGALFVDTEGVLRPYNKHQASAQDSKSLDFRWNTAGVTCYASHKYTKESGGAQDHQFRDQKRFLENFKHHDNPQTVCFAICDGAYYTPDKMKELENETRDKAPLSFAVHIEDVVEKLEIVANLGSKRRQ